VRAGPATNAGTVNVQGWGGVVRGFAVDPGNCASRGKREREPFAILELEGAGEWGLQNGDASFGPSVAAEFDVIKEWLEIEAGFTPLFTKGYPEWSTDFLFKKPFTLSNTVEFMVGAGPEWLYTNGGGKIAAEFALDLCFGHGRSVNSGGLSSRHIA
jgi:hypothetical protein